MSTEDIAAIGLKLETDGIEKGVKALDVLASKGPAVEKSMGQVEGAAKRTGKSLETLGRGTALDGLAQTSATAAAGMEKLGASSGKAQAALSGQATAAKSAVSSFDSLKSAVAGFSQTESQYIQKLVDEAKQLGMTRAERERYIAQSRGMSESAQQVAAAVGAKIDAYKREQVELGKTASATKDSAQSMLAMARTGVAAFLGGAVVQGAMSASKAMFDASASAERLRTMLDFSTGGNSAREIEYLRGVTQRLGLEFSSTAKAYGQFQAAAKGTSLEGDKARAVFESVAKASAVMGLSADQSSGVLLALQQMISKGTVQAEELRGQLGERLPGAFQIAAKAMGVTTGELGKMLEQGQVVADDFLPKFAKALEANIGDASEKAAGRLDASVNRVASAWDRLKQNAGDTGASKFMAGQYEILADGLTGVSQAMERARLSGSGFFGQIGSGAVAVARFVNPLQAFSYSAIETGNALKQAEAEFAALQKRGDVMGGNIYYKAEMANLAALIKELKAAQAEKQKLATGAAPNMNEGVVASGRAREMWNKNVEAANAFRLKQSGVTESYLKDMAELIRLNQAGVLVGKEYTDALAKQQDLLLKKTGAVKGSAAAANAEQNAYESLISSIRAKIEADKLEIEGGAALTESQRIRIKLDQDLAAGRVKLTAQNERAVRLALEELAASEASALAAKTLAKANLDAAASREKYLTSLSTGLDKIQADIAAQIEATERMGLSKEAIAELDAAKLEMLATDLELQAIKVMDKNLDEQQYEALMKQARAYRDLARAKREGGAKQAGIDAAKEAEKEAKKASDEWERAGERIEQSLTDSLMRGFENGKSAAENLRDTVKNMFKTLVLRPTISALMSPIAGAINGAVGGAAGSAGGGMLTSAGGSMLGGMMGGVSSLGIGASYGATSLFANGLGATLSAGGQMIGAGSVMSGIGTIAGALGPIALGIGAVVSLVKKLDDSGTMHTGALSQYSASSGLANSTTHGAFGMGFGGVDYSAETEKFTGAMAQSIVQMLDSTATTFGKEAGYKAATAFADDTSKDGAWGGLLISKLEETIINWDPTRTSRWAPKEFADGAAGKEQYLAAVAADVRVALESIGLPAWATGMLDKLGQGASIEQLAGAVDQINAAKAAFAGFAQYMPTFAGLADSAISKLVDASGGVQALAGNMAAFVDQFYSDAEKLAVNTENVRVAMGKLGFEMPTTRDEFAALVKANIALGDAGAETVAGLLKVAGAFAQVTPAAASASAALEAENRAYEEAMRAQQQAAADAARAIEEAAKKVQAITDALTADRVQLDIDLLRAMGQEDAALKKERERAIVGYNAHQIALYDSNQAIRDQIAGLEKQAEATKLAQERAAELASTLAGELPGVMEKFMAPAQRESSQYQRIAGSLNEAGIGVTADALMAATKDQIASVAMQVYNLGTTSDETRLAILRAASGLADLKDSAAAAAEAARNAAAQQRAGLETRLLQLQGNTVELRNREVAALEPANRALQRQIFALEDLAAAQGRLDAASSAITSEYLSAQSALESAQQGVTEVTRQAAQEMLNFGNSIVEFLNQLNTTTLGNTSPESRYFAAGEQFRKTAALAQSGDRDALGRITSVATDYLGASKAYYASGSGFSMDEGAVKAALQQILGVTGSGTAASAAVDPMVKAQEELVKAMERMNEIQAIVSATGVSTSVAATDLLGAFMAAQADVAKATADEAIWRAADKAAWETRDTLQQVMTDASLITSVQTQDSGVTLDYINTSTATIQAAAQTQTTILTAMATSSAATRESSEKTAQATEAVLNTLNAVLVENRSMAGQLAALRQKVAEMESNQRLAASAPAKV